MRLRDDVPVLVLLQRAWRWAPLIAVVALLVVSLVLALRDEGGGGGGDGVGAGGERRARVIRVVDGDTILVELSRRRERVRYIGIDTPESVKPDAPVECMGPRASHVNARLVEGREVELRFDRELRDDYGRLLAYVYVRGRSVNEELVRRGLARTLTIEPNTRYATRFARLESAAGRAGRGLWGRCPAASD